VKKKILIVDDSIVIRKILSDLISAQPELEVCGTAPNGKIALSKVGFLKPDLITLDIEMPEMDGLATLKELKKTHPDLPVIMVSSLTHQGAQTTIQALSLGANDYIAKPSSLNENNDSRAIFERELIPKIIHWSTQHMEEDNFPEVLIPKNRVINKKISVVIIGISTGGTTALAQVIPRLPKDFPVPILIVLHIPPVFSKTFADRLNELSGLYVKEASHGDLLLPGTVYVAPGDNHMEVKLESGKKIITLNKQEPVNFCRPSVDVMFESALDVYGKNTLAVIMTGMGSDGLASLRKLKEEGATIIAQDKESSTVWGMPGNAVKAGLADYVLPLSDIPKKLSTLLWI
jgi:two-component system, chemotaxis family, protein-glutamate methylesterase/glutaminase